MASDALDSHQGVFSAEQALRFLDHATESLAGSLDLDRTLGHIVQLMVPSFADWCAVDLSAEDGTLRQITSGHPDPGQERLLEELRRRYRAQRAGSEGVLRVIETGVPEVFADVRGAARARVEIRPDEAESYERLGPRSYMIVPLTARGRTLGAMTLLSTQEGRHYGDADLAFGSHLAGRFALAVDNARLYEAAERSRGLLDNLFTTAPVGLGFLDTELRFVRVNQALADLNGVPIEAHLGRSLRAVVGDDLADTMESDMRRVLERDEPAREVEVSGRSPAAPEDVRTWVASYTPLHGPDGDVVGLSKVVIDVTDRRRALEAERASAARARFLAEAGALLDASMDYEEVLNNLARLAVPGFADWCTVSLLDDGVLAQVAVAHADPAKTQWAVELGERYPPTVDPRAGIGKVLATGRPEVVNDVTDDLLTALAVDDEHLAILRELGLHAGVTAPLVSRGRILGALSFVSAESGRRYDDSDVQLLVEIGRRAGVAIENSRLYTERSRIAHTLQARLLPSRLASPPGVRLAARYRAAGKFNEVGGDFYDAFQRAPDEWVVVIGDVSGKGPEAAALTALARYTIRAAAANDWAPAHVLRRLNDTLLHEEGSQFVTVALAYLSHVSRDTRIRLVLGGHPLPFVIRAGGTVEQVGAPGTLLGIRSDVRLHEVEVLLAPDDSLLLYTDGVIEAGPRDAQFGENGLARVLAGLGGQDPETIVSAVDSAALAAGPGRARDDVALVALQALPAVAGHPVLEIARRATASEVRELRDAAVGFAAELPGVNLEAVRLAVGEACANAVVHAYRRSAHPGEIHLRAIALERGVVVEVRDDGCGPTPRDDSTGLGLGLPLMARLTRELQILGREPSGTLVRLVF